MQQNQGEQDDRLSPEEIAQEPGADHWSSRRDNDLTERELKEAIAWAERYAACYGRWYPGLNPMEVQSQCIHGAWYAHCTYPRSAPFEWSTHYRLTIRQWCKRAWRRPYQDLSLDAPEDWGTEEPAVDPRSEEEALLVRMAVSLLSPRQRSVIEGLYFQGLSSREFELNRTTVNQIRAQALRRLRDLLFGDVPWDAEEAEEDEIRPASEATAKVCVDETCRGEFWPKRIDQEYCSDRCKKRMQQRRYRERRQCQE